MRTGRVQVDSKEFKEAANFYINLMDHGESGAPRPDAPNA